VPDSADSSVNGAQPPTVFYTFLQRGRIYSAFISFAAGTDNSYTAAVTQLYARVSTAIGGINLGTVRLVVVTANDHDSDTNNFTGPDAGIPVEAGEELLLDLNNGSPIPGGFGLMGADCSVFYTIP
jgi:hypothetical protein